MNTTLGFAARCPLFLAALFVFASCGSSKNGNGADAGALDGAADGVTAATVQSPVPTTTWTIEEGFRFQGVTSSCTVRLADGTYRIYFHPSPTGGPPVGEFSSATSADGLTWSAPIETGVARVTGEVGSNPAVVRLADGTFVMIFEGQSQGSKAHRFYRATSPDGILFTRTQGALTGGAVMEPQSGDLDFVSVPDLVLLADGRLRMYFVAGEDHIDSAVSSDSGMTWAREGAIVLPGISSKYVVDPDVTVLPNGGYWLIFATTPEGETHLQNHRIRSALSVDGRNFTMETGDRVGVDNKTQIRFDPDVFVLSDGRYRVNFGEVNTTGSSSVTTLRTATSPVP